MGGNPIGAINIKKRNEAKTYCRESGCKYKYHQYQQQYHYQHHCQYYWRWCHCQEKCHKLSSWRAVPIPYIVIVSELHLQFTHSTHCMAQWFQFDQKSDMQPFLLNSAIFSLIFSLEISWRKIVILGAGLNYMLFCCILKQGEGTRVLSHSQNSSAAGGQQHAPQLWQQQKIYFLNPLFFPIPKDQTEK